MTEHPIAIVGAACRLPGAPSLAALETLLFDGRDAVSEIPDDRWNKAQFFHPDRGQPGKAYTFAAGVLDDIKGFDAGFFGISPREAAQVDPQQRLCLELAYEALEEAGIDAGLLAGEKVGVFVGGSSWDYLNLHVADASVIDAYSMTGVTLCSLANRVSYAFDLRGPSFTVDTACSSSLVALHQACEAIRTGQIPAALVGGVNLLLAPQSFVGFSAASMLSPRGRCHAFDARADGYVRAEGGGFVVLKPLSAALADGDDVKAVIHGTGVNSDGRTTGFSLPNQQAQMALLQDVYGRFGLHPEQLAYLEAHGTGTPAGDPIEAGALGAILGRARATPLKIGSVKTNIGHLEAASGMAGLMKALVTMRAGRIPPSLHCDTPNPAIPFDRLNLAPVRIEKDLVEDDEARLIGINSFGFGGTNAHAVIGPASAMPAGRPAPAPASATMPPLLLSAQSSTALRRLAERWHDLLAEEEPDRIPDLVRAGARQRQQLTRRAAIQGASINELKDALAALATDAAHPILAKDTAVDGKVAFVFSGNGSQWAGMAQDALMHSPAFVAALGEVDAALSPWLGWSVADALATPDADALTRTEVAQPLLFAVQVATVIALRAAGVTADAFMGHSVGEVAAAWASGSLDLDTAARIISARSRAQQRQHGVGRMAVLGVPAEQARALFAQAPLEGSGLEAAAHNGRQATTVAGPIEAIALLEREAKARGWRFTRLDLDYAFHSALMDPIRDDLLADLDDLAARPAGGGFVSTVTGAAFRQPLDAAYWWRNVREPVLFEDAATALVEAGVRIFVEIGPSPVLRAYLAEALRTADRDGRVIASLARRPVPRDPIAAAAMRCHAAGADIRKAAVFAGPHRAERLPRYPWQREDFWLDPSDEAADPAVLPSDHPMLGIRQGSGPAEWLRHVGLELQPWLADHVVGGAAVVPAAALIDAALAAARARAANGASLELLDVEIGRAMVLEPGIVRAMRFRVGSAAGDFEIASRPRLTGDPWTVHMRGRITEGASAAPLVAWPDEGERRAHLSPEALYALADRTGLHYGPAFRAVTGVDVLDGDRAAATLHDTGLHDAGFILAPDLVDGALQALLALAAGQLGSSNGVIPWRFGRIRLLTQAGAAPQRAVMRLTRIGPRSVRADIQLLDGEGAVRAELLDCWFVRVVLDAKDRRADMAYHTDLVATGAPWDRAAGFAGDLAPESAEAATANDLRLLAEAFASAAASEAIATIRDGDTVDRAGLMVASGADAAGLRTLDQLLHWLESDGILIADGPDRWTDGHALPASSTILGTILDDAPDAVAEVALLALASDQLAARLHGETAPSAPPTALIRQMLEASPASVAAMAALEDAVRRIAGGWTRPRPIRLIHLAAGRGELTLRLARMLDGRPFELVAITDADDLAMLQDRLQDHPAITVADTVPDREFDLVIAFQADHRNDGRDPLDRLPVGPGGVVLLADALPNRVWTLCLPDRRLRDEVAWRRLLGERTLVDPAVSIVDAGLWQSLLVQAQRPLDETDAPPTPASWLLRAADRSDLGAALARALVDRGQVVRLAGADALASSAEGMVLVFDGDAATLADDLASVARLAADPPARLAMVIRGGHDGDPYAAALTGAVRVFVNECETVPTMLVRVAPALTPDAAAERAADELTHPTGDTEVLWSAAARYVPRLRRGLPARPAAPAGQRLAIGRPGLLDSLHWTAAAPAAPGAGEIAIAIEAAALNFRDVMWAMGLLPDEALLDGFAGATLGLECAGIVTAVGDGVDRFAPGDRVMAFAPASLATHTVTAAHAVMAMPATLAFAEAATVPVAFLTVVYSVGHLARLQPGETILIHGGAGGVGLAAIQYARHVGARVFATAGSPAKRALLRALGVDAVLDSRSLSFADDVLRLTDGEGVDVVLNSLAGEAMRRSLALVKPFGRFVELGKRDFYENSAIGLRPFRHNVTYFAVDADQLPLKQPGLAARLFDEIADLFAQGALRPLPYRPFPFGDIEGAFRLMQSSGHVGKIVLRPTADRLRSAPAVAPFVADGDGVHIVTGGLGGFGLEAARWLVRHGARRLALLGRRGADTPDSTEVLAALADEGVDARAYACDVADEAGLAATLDRIRADHGAIVGIVHAAVAMDDALIGQLDADRFARALAPKLGGADLLDRLTRSDPVGLFVMFSSVTTAIGNPGQANYVAANAAMEAVAERRHGAGLPALAVQWGPIGDAGYLARTQDVSAMLERQLGHHHQTATEALDSLPDMLATGRPVIGMAAVNWGALRKRLPLLAAPMFAPMSRDVVDDAPEVDLRALLASGTAEEAQDRATAMLVEEVARIMKLPADRIEPQRPLTEIGMDSLMAVELRLAVEQRFGVTVPLLALSEGASLSAMAARILRGLGGEAAAAQPAAQIADRLRQLEGRPFDGPQDHAREPSEATFAAAAASAP